MTANSDFYRDFTLLVDGRNTFPVLLDAISHAQKSLLINMFIWRDDEIGNRIAQAVLDAAERGVKVTLSVDRYGVVLEKCEEGKRSFFHKRQRLSERIKIAVLQLMYPMKGTPKCKKDVQSPLYRRIVTHPNIHMDCDRFKADHSKYFVIDEEILFLGGINIEDKENGADMQGRVYQDYMVKIIGKDHVNVFFDKMLHGKNSADSYFFGINRKSAPRLFEMERVYLDMINSAQKRLQITMAYFSPLPQFMKAIADAYRRGVEVTVMIPLCANFQNASNYKAVKKLMRSTQNGIRLLLSPKMVHTKMIITESAISFGSTNITQKAFKQLDELNLNLKNIPADFCVSVLESVEENYALCRRVLDSRELSYNRLSAFLEGFLV